MGDLSPTEFARQAGAAALLVVALDHIHHVQTRLMMLYSADCEAMTLAQKVLRTAEEGLQVALGAIRADSKRDVAVVFGRS